MLPVEPKLGKMLILGAIFNCLDPVMTVVAGLSMRDPFLMPFDKKDVSMIWCSLLQFDVLICAVAYFDDVSPPLACQHILHKHRLRTNRIVFKFCSLQNQQKRSSLPVITVIILLLSELMMVGKMLKECSLVMSTAGGIFFLHKL